MGESWRLVKIYMRQIWTLQPIDVFQNFTQYCLWSVIKLGRFKMSLKNWERQWKLWNQRESAAEYCNHGRYSSRKNSNKLHKYYTNIFILPCCLWGEEMVFWLTWKLVVLRWDEDDLLVSRSWNNSTPFLSSFYFPVLCFNKILLRKRYTLHFDTVVIIHIAP